MQWRWVGKNVDLALLSQHVEAFFTRKGFYATAHKSPKGYELSIKPQRRDDPLGHVMVRILGDSQDFSIELVSSKHPHSTIKWGWLTSLFGGGFLLLRGLKSKEALDKLENDLWIYLERTIASLTNSTS